jgi:hypothetical protein
MHSFAKPGRHTATVTVSDAHGHRAIATVAVDVTAVAPRITRLRVAPRRVQIGTVLPKLVRTSVKRPLSTIRFTLSKPATVRLSFAKLGRHGRASVVRKTVRIKARQGVNRVRFAARLSRKVRLTPGAYRLTMVAAGAPSTRATTRFTAIAATRR